jgi:hypothetical protein
VRQEPEDRDCSVTPELHPEVLRPCCADLPTTCVCSNVHACREGSLTVFGGRAQVFFGVCGDYLGRKRVYLVTLVIMIVATLGQALSASPIRGWGCAAGRRSQAVAAPAAARQTSSSTAGGLKHYKIATAPPVPSCLFASTRLVQS